MADLNKFQRSKERITEVLNYLMQTHGEDHKTNPFINTLEQSIQIIDSKIEELEKSQAGEN